MDPTNPLHLDPPPLTRRGRLAGGLGLSIVVALAIWQISTWQLSGRHDPPPVGKSVARSVWDRNPDGPYVGSVACAECHPGESAHFTRSGHARTFRDPSLLAIARELDGKFANDPERPTEQWAYQLTDGEFWIERWSGEAPERFKVDYALGSGHNAVTFVTITDRQKPTGLEHRLTYYSRGQTLLVTPGQQADRPLPGVMPHGRELSPGLTVKCLGCHSTPTRLGGKEADLDTMTPNVQCERCHGPGRSHVDAARAGREDLRMPFGAGRWTSDQQMNMCGQCHRHPSNASAGQVRREDPAIVRFQPVGLMRSNCYTRSGGTLSCVTCHDPHCRASTDTSAYEAACLGCHESGPQKVCPTSRRGGCLECHMPKINSGQSVLFTDHWIRARMPSDPSTDR